MTEPLTPPAITPRVGTMKLRNKRYYDGSQDYQRVSKMLENLKTWGDTWNLQMWQKRQVAIGMSGRPDLVLGVQAAIQFDPATGKLTDDAKKAINGLCDQAGDVAGNKAGSNAGTAVHTATERLDLGESVESIALPYPYSADLQAYAVLKKAMGLTFRPEHIERTVRNDALAAAGTYDRIGSCTLLEERGILAPGEKIIVDVKTEQDPLLNLIHIAPQLASYAYADVQWVPTPVQGDEYAGAYEDMPNVSRMVALVVHVRAGRAEPILINLVEGWEAAQAAAAQRERVKASKRKLGEPGCWAVPVAVELPPATALTADAHARGPLGFSAPAGTTPEQFRAEPVPTVASTEAYLAGQLDEIDKSAIENVWAAVDLFALAETYRIYTEVCGRTWGGRVEEAGAARARQIECVQRALHGSAGKCACGWVTGVAP